ncbi:CHASE3 domain-containing protein [Paenibacillus sp. JX-17]|uniref:histidine kinase n=1 Tax=Paenibacillus lacisoli TaxID=3064525 RepID=A0ABT9C8C1_9BACL|nr:CHASE3 domain-containing protein [Paenibacillus sp. JX-17]MDO7904853.1 CHASE3 domain-containing protein [Paenibacillus sp. JX-17]
MRQRFRFNIRTKILLGYVLIVICLGIFLFVMSDRINQLQEENQYITQHDLQVHNLTNGLEKHVLDMETSQRGYVITGNESYLEPYDQAKVVWENDFNTLYGLVADNPAQQRNLDVIKSHIENWMKVAGEPVIAAKRQGQEEEVTAFFTADPGKAEIDNLRTQLATFRDTELGLTQQRADRLTASNERMLIVMYSIWGAIILLSIAAGMTISGNIARTINQVTGTIRDMYNGGNLGQRIKVKTNDEVRDLGNATNDLLDSLERQNWAKDQIAATATMLQNPLGIHELTQQFVSRLAELLELPYALLYLVNEHTELKRSAAFAAGPEHGKEQGEAYFRAGQGLAGQCALENRMLVVHDLPPGYVSVNSGLGSAAPRVLILAPVSFEGRVRAVIEIAAMRPLHPEQMNLLQELCSILGVSIHSTQINMEVQRLYAESQAMNEELQVQSEELQAQTEELQAQTEEMSMQTEELHILNDKLEEQKSAAENAAAELEKYAEQLAKSSDYKSEFLANMSHELRTPLNSMLILSEILSENKHQNLSEEEQQYASVIHSSGKDLLTLINDILDLSKVEAGEMLIEYDPINLSELPDTLNTYFLKTAEKKNVDFRIQLDKKLPQLFYSDGNRLQQILRNLLSNAFKFTSRGEVSLTVTRLKSEVDTEAGPSSDILAFTVADTGIGIPEEKQQLIFEAFKQVDGANTRKFGGTGLGLSISLSLARLLGGTITLQSEEGKGSAFTLFLPCLEEEPQDDSALFIQQEAAAAIEEPARLKPVPRPVMPISPEELFTPLEEQMFRGSKVLVVDDDIRNVYALANALENFDMSVITAQNGRECLELLREHDDVDIVLMDIMMPEMDGYETIREIRGTYGMNTLPIIALTAKAMKEDREKCLAVGANDYISKPLNIREVVSRMKLWLTNRVTHHTS